MKQSILLWFDQKNLGLTRTMWKKEGCSPRYSFYFLFFLFLLFSFWV